MSDKTICEGRLCFDFTKSINVYKADIPTLCGIGGVDFIVEVEDKFIFIEVKDLENKKVPKEQRIEWIKKLSIIKNNEFLRDLGMKFKDTIIRNWAKDIYFPKPILYTVILELDSIDSNLRLKLSEDMHGILPTSINEKHGFTKKLKIKGREIINLKEWRRKYPEFTVKEID